MLASKVKPQTLTSLEELLYKYTYLDKATCHTMANGCLEELEQHMKDRRKKLAGNYSELQVCNRTIVDVIEFLRGTNK
jgi:hypothetical protein